MYPRHSSSHYLRHRWEFLSKVAGQLYSYVHVGFEGGIISPISQSWLHFNPILMSLLVISITSDPNPIFLVKDGVTNAPINSLNYYCTTSGI